MPRRELVHLLNERHRAGWREGDIWQRWYRPDVSLQWHHGLWRRPWLRRLLCRCVNVLLLSGAERYGCDECQGQQNGPGTEVEAWCHGTHPSLNSGSGDRRPCPGISPSTSTVGIAALRLRSTSAIARASAALYRAKQSGLQARRPFCTPSSIVSLPSCAGPNANVIVPARTTFPSTRAKPYSCPMRLRKRFTRASISTVSPGWTGLR